MKRKQFILMLLVLISVGGGYAIYHFCLDTWENRPVLEIHLKEEDDLELVINEMLTTSKNKEFYKNGLKVTGIIDNQDFSYLCSYFRSPILDLSEAVFKEDQITCRFGHDEVYMQNVSSPIKKILLPIAEQGYYDLQDSFFTYMNKIEYVDARYVYDLGRNVFFDSTIKTIVFSDRFILRNASFYGKNRITSLDITGIEEWNTSAIGGDRIKEVIIRNTIPPRLVDTVGVGFPQNPKYTLKIPEGVEWDLFVEELIKYNFPGEIERIPNQ